MRTRYAFLVALFLSVVPHSLSFKPIRSPLSSKGSGAMRMSLKDPPMELCDENAVLVIEEIKYELGTIFGYDEESRKVGITGCHMKYARNYS